MGDGPDVGSGVLDGDGDSNGDDDSDVWTRMFGMVVAGVVAVVGFATVDRERPSGVGVHPVCECEELLVAGRLHYPSTADSHGAGDSPSKASISR